MGNCPDLTESLWACSMLPDARIGSPLATTPGALEEELADDKPPRAVLLLCENKCSLLFWPPTVRISPGQQMPAHPLLPNLLLPLCSLVLLGSRELGGHSGPHPPGSCHP
jgi:hypothetical protein